MVRWPFLAPSMIYPKCRILMPTALPTIVSINDICSSGPLQRRTGLAPRALVPLPPPHSLVYISSITMALLHRLPTSPPCPNHHRPCRRFVGLFAHHRPPCCFFGRRLHSYIITLFSTYSMNGHRHYKRIYACGLIGPVLNCGSRAWWRSARSDLDLYHHVR